MTSQRQLPDRELTGLKVLVMLPPSHKGHAQRFARIIEAAKVRWGWTVDVLCQLGDEQAYQAVAAPSGKVFTRPHMLQAQAWENDAETLVDVERRLREAELSAQMPVGKMVAATPASIGRAYVLAARHRYSSPMARRVLEDNAEPFRIVRRFFGFADNMLAASAPDLVVAHEWGTPLHCCVWLAATGRSIRCVAMPRSKVHSGHNYWTTHPLMLNAAALADAAVRRRSEAPVSDAAKTQIQGFREKPEMTVYVAAKWQLTGQRWHMRLMDTWLTLPSSFARALGADLLYRIRGFDLAQRPPLRERLIAPRRRTAVGRRQRRFLRAFADAELAAMKYVYFPMHKETDMPLTFQATVWQNQRNTVELLASGLPAGYQLLVRENRLNYGQRPKSYYPQMLQLPNVVLIDAFDSQYKYLRHADLIVTENGSSGWEGLLLGRRVLTLAPNFYDGAGLTVEVRDLNQLHATILNVLSQPAVADPATHDRSLGHMIDAEMATTFPDDSGNVSDALKRLAQTLTGAVHPHLVAPQELVS